jgi:hypothetical protein
MTNLLAVWGHWPYLERLVEDTLRRRDSPRLEKQLEEMDKETTVSSLLPTHYAFSVLNKNGHNSLHTEV